MIASLPLEKKIGQLFCIGIDGPEVDDPTRSLLDEISPGGVCLFARNIKERRQTRSLLDEIRTMLPVEPMLAVDQEGGLVDRLRRIMAPMPAAAGISTAEEAAELGKIVSETLRILGFNTDFAPVVDVIDEERSRLTNGLFSRAFGRSKEDVAAFAGAFLDALETGGIAGCLKHFPGLGAASVDSHDELPSIDVSPEEFESTDLFPYKYLIRSSRAVMVAHAAYPGSDLQEKDKSGKLLPSSLSYNFISGLLRGELGFDGLVITDDLEMGAIIKNYGIADACKMAIHAGADMLAICAGRENVLAGHGAVRDAVAAGEIPETRIEGSLRRIAKFKERLSAPTTFDEARLDEVTVKIAAFSGRLATN